MKRFVIRTLLALAACGALPGTARAQGNDPYDACAALTDDAARLECFDTAYAQSRSSQASRERAAAEQAQRAEEVRAREFGLSPTERQERRDDVAAADPQAGEDLARLEEEEAEARDFSLEVRVAEVWQDGTRKRILRLDNGQLWRETSGSTLRNRVQEGWQGTITRHWSGAYEIRFEGRNGYVRIARIQ